MEVYCDKCTAVFEVELQEKIVGDTKEIYFYCEHCGKKYEAGKVKK